MKGLILQISGVSVLGGAAMALLTLTLQAANADARAGDLRFLLTNGGICGTDFPLPESAIIAF